MKLHRNPLHRAVSHALSMGLVAGLAVTAAPALAQDEGNSDSELDRLQVTGSRIVRSNVEGALPVTVIDREAIDLSGNTSVADLLRDTSFNVAGSFRPQSGSSAQSFAGINMRGLGEGRTLILIDGRRVPTSPTFGSAQDLNSIPLGMVERIEILSDGASAVYGSDAIGGVINIITRADYEGAEIMYGLSDPKRDGGDTEEGHVLFGISGDRGHIMAGASFNQRDIVWQRDREWSRGGASTYSNNFLQSPAFNDFIDHPDGPAVPGSGCTTEGFSINPNGSCAYDFTLQAADEAEIRNESLFARGRYDINLDWSAYMNASVTRVKSFGRYAPVPSSPWPGGAISISPDSPNHPGNPDGYNAGNTDGYDPNETVWLQHRFAALGPRDNDIETNVYDIDLGLDGRIGNWDLNVGARQTESKTKEIGRNYVVAGLAQPRIESGEYNIYDPSSLTDDIANAMITTTARDASFRLREVYGSVSSELFNLPAGAVGFAAGFEYREEEFADIYDSLSEAGQVVGSSGNSAAGDRDVKAAFVEFLVPIIDNLELTLAGRYDDYSDYGDDFSPKVALRYQPIDAVNFRASWAKGFRAPSLDILSQQPSFSAESVVHAPTAEAAGIDPGQSIQINTYQLSNPNLGSESSEQWSLGVGFQPTGWLSGSLDYWSIEIDDSISFASPQQIINCLEGLTQNCPSGLTEFDPDLADQVPDPSLGLGMAFNPANGAILFGQTGFSNFGTVETSGLDLGLSTNFDFGGAGRLRNDLQVTYVDQYELNGESLEGDVDRPQYRATLMNRYDILDFSFAWNISYIGSQDTNWTLGDEGRVPSWVTHDLQASYHAPWNGQLTVGVNNVADRDPPIDLGHTSGRGFNFDLYDGYGRVPYVRYTQRF